jgi:hypothetical protein
VPDDDVVLEPELAHAPAVRLVGDPRHGHRESVYDRVMNVGSTEFGKERSRGLCRRRERA